MLLDDLVQPSYAFLSVNLPLQLRLIPKIYNQDIGVAIVYNLF